MRSQSILNRRGGILIEVICTNVEESFIIRGVI